MIWHIAAAWGSRRLGHGRLAPSYRIEPGESWEEYHPVTGLLLWSRQLPDKLTHVVLGPGLMAGVINHGLAHGHLGLKWAATDHDGDVRLAGDGCCVYTAYPNLRVTHHLEAT